MARIVTWAQLANRTRFSNKLEDSLGDANVKSMSFENGLLTVQHKNDVVLDIPVHNILGMKFVKDEQKKK